MVTFLFQIRYTTEGVRGVIKDGGRARADATRGFMEALGGRIVHQGFTFGEFDSVLIVELPSEAAGVAAAFIGRSAGTNDVRTTRIYDVSEIEESKAIADNLMSQFSPPGS